jgi:RNA polymerase sigma-70 factor (ECF subfamily)
LAQPEELDQIKAGDEAAFELVFKKYYALLCNYGYTFLHDKAEAEEVVQSTFLAFWEKRHSLDVHTSVKAYLFSMVRNASLNVLKHKKVESRYAQDEIMTAQRSIEPLSQTIHSNELDRKIAEAMEKLPEQCRMVFKLSRFEELKYAEIAVHLNISVKTVENQIGKALKIMREQLRDYLPLILMLMNGFLSE